MEKLIYIQRTINHNLDAIKNTLDLLESGATVPFIARYRKERTQGLDEVQIADIRDLSKKYDEIVSFQQTICSALDKLEDMSDLKRKVLETFDLVELEDLYLPFKVKRKTKGEIAKELGLLPLAKQLMVQSPQDPISLGERYAKGKVETAEEALEGARDIIAEWINENVSLRKALRKLFHTRSQIESKRNTKVEDEGEKYRDYYAISEPVSKCSNHRFLAIYRAANAKVIRLKLAPSKEQALETIERYFVKGNNLCSEQVSLACKESYKRLLSPSLETELINTLKQKADTAAIAVFSQNLKELLLAAPLGKKRILAIDPGFRTGCKVVCLDETGSLLTNTTIYPHPPQKEISQAKAKLGQLVEAYKIEAIAIGDGTAGRETEWLVKQTHFSKDLEVYSVREDGASIYSASSIARKEFPDYDVTVRGAVSIGRRLMDPLAELVKIDAKSIGVGQYQHDVNQVQLKESLDDVVSSCVNKVGVELNTASSYLLSYVSGLGPGLAENIVQYRNENGVFNSRKELLSVPRLGAKAYEQAAGFLRIRDGAEPLDNSAIHPENYKDVAQIAKKLKCTAEELIGNQEISESEIKNLGLPIDEYTLKDIVSELKKPGRDPRKKVKVLEFDASLRSISDLKVGMRIQGIVTNVTSFGAFVNIGIKENGLIHKSNLANEFVNDPSDYIKVHEHVEVEVLEVDEARKRIGLGKVLEG